MAKRIFALHLKILDLLASEEGQDLVEYGLVAALISVAAVAGIGEVAAAVLKMFTNINTMLT